MQILPFDMLALTGDTDNASRLKIIRLVRLMRLLKLIRVVKASRIYERFEEKISVSYSIISLIKFLVLLLVFGHWLACCWCLVAVMEPPGEYTWIDALRETLEEDGRSETVYEVNDDAVFLLPGRGVAPSTIYSASIYWAIVTITSIGYGDITPVNKTEMQWATGFSLFGAIIWAYIIGSFCSLLSTLDVETIEHQQLMDGLNNLVCAHQLEPELRSELRRYFIQRKKLNRATKESALIRLMSPSLRMRTVKGKCEWLLRVPYLKNSNLLLLTDIEARLRGQVFPPSEELLWKDSLCHLASGMASRDGRVLCKGAFWGADSILQNTQLKITTTVFALTFIEVLDISRADLLECINAYTEERKELRKAHLRLAAMRGILHTTNLMRSGHSGTIPWLRDLESRMKTNTPYKKPPDTPLLNVNPERTAVTLVDFNPASPTHHLNSPSRSAHYTLPAAIPAEGSSNAVLQEALKALEKAEVALRDVVASKAAVLAALQGPSSQASS